MKTELVFTNKKEVFTSSVIVAEMLGVGHSDLMRTVKKVLDRKKNNPPASALKFPQKFIESSFTNKMGRTYKMYEMNEQAYMKLAMQLSGYEKAEIVQDAIIEAFALMKEALLQNHNASWIAARKQTKAIRQQETDVIKEFVEYATAQGSKSAKMYYMNITKMTNKALELLLQTSYGTPLRDLANVTQQGYIQMLDNRAMQAIEFGMKEQYPYKLIYKYAKDEVNKLSESLAFKPIENNE